MNPIQNRTQDKSQLFNSIEESFFFRPKNIPIRKFLKIMVVSVNRSLKSIDKLKLIDNVIIEKEDEEKVVYKLVQNNSELSFFQK